jgi:cytosine/adenosine deaminase-related metal-dependent hydrolase
VKVVTASWVLPMTGPALRHGRVGVKDGRIAWVEPAGDAASLGETVVDLGPGVLLPGLVNAHCHLELSSLAGRLPLPSPFVPWVAALVAARAGETGDRVREATARAIASMEASGTVAVGDVSNALGHLDLLAASGLDAVVFYELIGWDPLAADGILAGADERLRGVGLRPARNVEIRLAAHAPHSVSPALFAGLLVRGGPASLHLAESEAESRFLAGEDSEWSGFLADRVGAVPFIAPRRSPVRYVSEMGVLRPHLVAAHCARVDADDRALLARAGVHVAVCPRSNRNLGVGVPPVPDLLAAGVRLCLGTDSLASAPSLDLLADAAQLRREFPSLRAADIVGMATTGGARALGREDLGSLAPGKRAAFAFAAAKADPEDPFEFLVSGEAHAVRVPA